MWNKTRYHNDLEYRERHIKHVLKSKERHREGFLEYQREYRRTHNSPEYLKYQREYGRNNRESRREWDRRYRRRYRLLVINHLGPKCKDCGSKDFLELHHINGDGKEDRKRFSNNRELHRHYSQNLEEAEDKLQVLCRACNSKKNRKYD